MNNWQHLAEWWDVLAIVLASLLGALGGRASVRRRLRTTLQALVVPELAKLLRPSLASDLKALLDKQNGAHVQRLEDALAQLRANVRQDTRELMRAEGASREALEDLAKRMATAEGRLSVLQGAEARPAS